MKILHINTVIGRGGAGKVVETLMSDQLKNGHLSTAAVAWDYRINMTGNCDIYPSETSQNQFWPDYHVKRGFDIIMSQNFQQADLVHIHNIHGNYFNPLMLLLIGIQKPTLWTLHDMDAITGHCTNSLDCERWELGCGSCPYLAIPKKLAVDNTNALILAKKEIYDNVQLNIVAPSKWLFKITSRSILKNHALYHIPNPLKAFQSAPLSKTQARNHFGIDQDWLVLGMVADGGYNNPYKGIDIFIQVLDLLNAGGHNRRFLGLIIGGDQECELSSYVKVTQRATSDDNRMSAFYHSLDVYLCTSVAENYPLSILEAMTCNIPIVGNTIGGVPELLRDDCGIIAEENEPQSLANAVLFLLERPMMVANLVKNSAHKVYTHNHQIIGNHYLETYNTCLNNFSHHNGTITLKKQPNHFISQEVQGLLRENKINLV